jgi:hypothetical protein
MARPADEETDDGGPVGSVDASGRLKLTQEHIADLVARKHRYEEREAQTFGDYTGQSFGERVSQDALDQLKLQAKTDLDMYRAQLDAYRDQAAKSAPGMRIASPHTLVHNEYTLRVRVGQNGGYAVWIDNEMYVAANTDELARVIITAIVKKKITT